MNEFEPMAKAFGNLSERVAVTERRVLNPRSGARSPWQEPSSFSNSWTNFGSSYDDAGYALDNNGFVHFKGLVKTGSSGTAIFTLPETLRPEKRQYIAVAAFGGPAILHVQTTGVVTITGLASATVSTWTSLHGACFQRQSYPDGISWLGDSAYSDADLETDIWDIPWSLRHVGGMIFAGGMAEFGAAPSTNQLVYTLDNAHGSGYISSLVGIGSTNFIRWSLQRDSVKWTAGNDGTGYHSFAGLCWPSPEMERTTSYNDATLSGSATEYGSSFPATSRVYTDSMGMKYLSFLVNNSASSSGTTLMTLDAADRPAADCILPGLNNNSWMPVTIRSDGDVEMGAAGTNSWVSVGHPFWVDNG